MPTCDPACEDDAGLLRAWCEHRDEAALAALFARHAPALRAIARRVLRDEAEAEDVVQEVLIRLSGHAGAIAGPVEPWLRQVAAHAAISALRSRNRRRAREAQAATPSGGQPVLPATGENLHDLVAECVAALTPAERDLVLRVFWGGEAQRDLARELRVSPVAVHKRLRVSLDNLRRLLARRGVRVGAAALLAGLGQLCGQEPSAMAALVRRPGQWWMFAWMAGALSLVSVVAVLAAVGRTAAAPGLVPDPAAAPAPAAVPAQPPAAARAGRGTEPVEPGVEPPFWRLRTAAGWSALTPAELSFWLVTGTERASARRVRLGDPVLRVEGGADPVLHCLVPAGGTLVVAVPLLAAYDRGGLIRIDFCWQAGDQPKWRELVLCQVRARELKGAPMVTATFDGAASHDRPQVVGSGLADSGPQSIAGCQLDGLPLQASIGLSAWSDPGEVFIPMAGKPPWVPVVLTAGHHLLRRLQARALSAGERQELLELVRAAPAQRLSEQ